MGIPSYFSHIVKKHREIIKKFNKNTINIDNLYIDSNSIVYDIINELNNKNCIITNQLVIDMTCDKIKEYIENINPKKNILIAFDGVAPVAKLKQQRRRRYLSNFQNEILEKIKQNTTTTEETQATTNSINKWSTLNITPGTNFMNELKIKLNHYFNNYLNEYKVKNNSSINIIISCSDEIGEGEHKIYKIIRDNDEYHKNTTTVIYGLDADLIMLTLIHLNITTNMYLFRETPHFIKHIDNTLNPYEMYILDIPLVSRHIINDIFNVSTLKNTLNNNDLINDYILICFMLGNDFMPHFPSINIRSNGIDILISAYKQAGKNLTTNCIINWKNLRYFINILATNEREYLKKEINHLIKNNKFNNRNNNHNHSNNNSNNDSNNHSGNNKNNYDEILLNLPSSNRDIESYINPNDDGWEYRYYKTLFNIEIDDVRRKQICINYLEGLEWTLKYYSSDCKNWRWKYNYDYPPLLSDLIKYIPYFDTEFIKEVKNNNIDDLTQLCYVLPYKGLYLLPEHIKSILLETHPEWYSTNFNIKWVFCKYFWESTVDLCDIDLNILEKIVSMHNNING
jgi:5'-3' exonuclease